VSDDLVKDLTKKSDTVKGAIRGFFDTVGAVGGAVNEAIGITKPSPGLPSQGYNRDGTPPEYPVHKVDDSIKKIPK
jgi:hypothetical protein